MIKRSIGLIAYLIIAFGLAWAAWGAALLLGFLPAHGLAFQAALLPAWFAPAAAAVIVRRWVTHEGFTDSRLRLNIRRWPFYLLAWFLPLIAVSIIVLLGYAFNLSLPDYSLQRGYIDLTGASPPAGFQFIHLLLLFVVMTPLLAPIMLGQEFGWRGYLQPRLFPQRPQLSALVTGILWALWYLPFYLAGCSSYDPTGTWVTYLLFAANAVLLAIIYGWLQARTASVWAPALAHAGTVLLGGGLAMVLFGGGPNFAWLNFGGVLSLIPLGLISLYIAMSNY
jgi:membrane protease YdiL (CAAX protease family)